MTQAARYLFDLDFSAPPEPEIEEEIEEIPPEPMITVAEHERLLAQAIEKAQIEGETRAREERELLASEESLKVQQSILNETAMIYTEVGHLLRRLERDASNLAFAFASRFAERLVAQEPKIEVQALLNQILAPLRQTPHISIRLNETIADDIKQAVDQQMAELGFSGKLTILPDPAIVPGDCEVEWADGGIGRNMRSAIRKVEQLLDDHFADVPLEEDEQELDEQTDADLSEIPDEMTDLADQEPTQAPDLSDEEAPQISATQTEAPTDEMETGLEEEAEVNGEMQ